MCLVPGCMLYVRSPLYRRLSQPSLFFAVTALLHRTYFTQPLSPSSIGVLSTIPPFLTALSIPPQTLDLTPHLFHQARIPERFAPGAFDLFGASHQIFHMLVLLAAAAHFKGLLVAFEYEHGLRLGDG